MGSSAAWICQELREYNNPKTFISLPFRNAWRSQHVLFIEENASPVTMATRLDSPSLLTNTDTPNLGVEVALLHGVRGQGVEASVVRVQQRRVDVVILALTTVTENFTRQESEQEYLPVLTRACLP